MFIGAFQNGLRARHFNKSLAKRSAFSLDKEVTHEKFYIMGEESNVEKKTRDAKKLASNIESS